MELISMTDFVLSKEQALIDYEKIHYYGEVLDIALEMVKYANFLKQSLELWMFVPCDENGNVLNKPENYDNEELWHNYSDCKKYEKAKERCLFEVTSEFVSNNIYDENGFFHTLENIESLVADYNNYNLTLTKTAINQLTT